MEEERKASVGSQLFISSTEVRGFVDKVVLHHRQFLVWEGKGDSLDADLYRR